jgi:predicted amidohydrolase YtcJ
MRRSYLLALALCGSLGVDRAGAEVWNPAADTIIAGGTVVTMGKVPVAEALAIKDGKIIGVGSAEEVLKLRGASTRVVDAKGKTILPGLQDSHIHPLSLGRDTLLQADLINVRSPKELSKSLSELKERVQPKSGQWLLGARWDASQIKPMFTRWDIDPVTHDNPVSLSRYRGLAVNTAAFAAMGIKDDDPATWPKWWTEDPADFTAEDTIYRAQRTIKVDGAGKKYNVPTGVFIGTQALKLVTAKPPRPGIEDDVESVRLGSRELLKVGITSVIDAGNGMGYNNRIYQIARDRGFLDVKIPASYEGIFFVQTPAEIRTHLNAIKFSNIGDSRLRLRGVKIYGDGGPSARGSWVTKAYEPSPEHQESDFGNPVVADYAQREAQYRAMIEYGWDLHTHSTGDAAMLETVRLYRKLMDEIRATRPDADLRWSVEHANMPLETPEVMETMANYRIIASVQPVMISELGNAWLPNLGEERVARSIPVASYMKRGVTVVSGSDYGVTPFDPWQGVYAMVTRKDKYNGKVYGADERVSLADALKTYTINGAYATYEENSRGSLDIGKAADLVVLELRGLEEFERNPELLRTAASRVVATLVDGVPRYQKPGAELFK